MLLTTSSSTTITTCNKHTLSHFQTITVDNCDRSLLCERLWDGFNSRECSEAANGTQQWRHRVCNTITNTIFLISPAPSASVLAPNLITPQICNTVAANLITSNVFLYHRRKSDYATVEDRRERLVTWILTPGCWRSIWASFGNSRIYIGLDQRNWNCEILWLFQFMMNLCSYPSLHHMLIYFVFGWIGIERKKWIWRRNKRLRFKFYFLIFF